MGQATTNNNPGNLKYAGQSGAKNNGGFAQFSSPDDGYIALMNDLNSKVGGASSTGLTSNHTLSDLASKYAPPTENDTDQYVLNLANQLKVSPDTKLSNLQSRVPELASAIAHNEDKDFANKNQLGFNPKPFSSGQIDFSGLNQQTPEQPQNQGFVQGLGSDLQNRVSQAGNAASQTLKGEINPLSGITQVVGAVAGGLGDVVNRGLELIPGVKQVENLIGQGVGSLAKTSAGQSVMKSIKDFSTEHPELSNDIGAGFNIITAIPILKGLGAIKNVAMDGISMALKDVAGKSMANGVPNVIAKGGKAAVQFLDRNPEIGKKIVEKEIFPSVENGKWATSDAVYKSQSAVGDINKEVKSILNSEKYSTVAEDSKPILENTLKGYIDRSGNAVEGFPRSRFTTDDILNNARELTPQNNLLWDKFEANQASIGEINQLRSEIDTAVKSVYTKISSPPIKKEMGAKLAGAMRDFVQTNAQETQPLFSDMVDHFNIQKGLGYMENKSVKTGLMHQLIGGISTGAGAAIGGAFGNPIIGGMAGFASRGYVEKQLGGLTGAEIRNNILKRTAEGAARQTVGGMVKNTGGLIGAALSQKLNR